MGSGLYRLRVLQVGKETTPGTAVAATQRVIGAATLTPEIDRYEETYPRGVRVMASPDDADVRKGSLLTMDADLDFEHVLVPLNCGLAKGTITRVAPPTTPATYTHAFQPSVTAAVLLHAFTAEVAVSDGSTKHYEREVAYGTVRSLTITWAANEMTKLAYEAFGRAEQSSALTPSLAVVAGRELIPSNRWTLAIDDTRAKLGATQITGIFRGGSLAITGGAEPKYTIDGRTDLDFTGLDTRNLTAELSLTLEHDAVAAGEFAKWRSDDLRYIRLAAVNGDKKIEIDLTAKFSEPPSFGDEDGIETLSFAAQLHYDATGAPLKVSVTNELASFT